MAMTAVAELVDALQPLLDPGQLEQLPSLANGLEDAKTLAQRLLALDWLTPFQVNCLLQKRGAQLVLGPYNLLQKLGEGGTGRVFKARHQRMQRIVALKVIRRELLADPEILARFYREIQVASQVAHPNVVHAYDAGPSDDCHFLAMEYVQGVDLSRLVKLSGRLTVKQACDFIRQAALGLQHIHEHGLVHRDIKPSNLLLAEGHGSPSVGLVKILDLGLARFQQPLEEEVTGTFGPAGGVMMGTPDYMAPEQALNFHQADIRSDIYSLGCSLYYLLTGQPPFPGGTLAQKLLAHQQTKPPALTQLRPDAPLELLPILNRMLAKLPAERYQTPGELADALAAATACWAEESTGATTNVATATPAYDASKLVTPAIPLPAAAATMFGDMPPLAIPVDEEALTEGTVKNSTESATAVLGDEPAPLSDDPLSFAKGLPPPKVDDAGFLIPAPSETAGPNWRLRLLLIGGGLLALLLLLLLLRALMAGRPSATRLHDGVESKLTTQPIPTQERFDWQPPELVAVLGEHRLRHWGSALGIAFTTDGKEAFSYGMDNAIRFWDPSTGRECKVCPGQKGWALPMIFSANGKTVFTSSLDNTVRQWEVATGKEKRAYIGHGGRILSVSLALDGKILASASQDGIKIWDVDSGQQRHWFTISGTIPPAPMLSPDGKTLAYCGPAFSVRLVDVAKQKDRAVLDGHRLGVALFCFSRDGKLLASASYDKTIRIWDVVEGKAGHVLPGHTQAATALEFSPDGKTLASGSAYGHIKLWDLATGKELAARQGHFAAVAGLAISPDNSTLVSCSHDGTLRIWELADLTERCPLQGHQALVRFVAFSPDGKTLASGSGDKIIRLWDVADVKERQTFVSGDAPTIAEAPVLGAYTVVFGPAPTQTLATANHDGTIRLHDLASGNELRVLFRAVGLHAVGLAGDATGKWLAVALSDSTVRLVESTTGKELAALKGHTKPVTSLAFSPDNQFLVTGSTDGTVRLWDMPLGNQRALLPAKVDSVAAVAISADGRTLALGGGDDRFVHLWDLNQQKERDVLSGHAGRVSALAFAPTGTTLAAAGIDGRIITWDAQSKTKQHEWLLPGAVNSVAFTPDGNHIATANSNGTIYILRVKPTAR
jgi:WD40 repeat protein/serine/threonine protein kinase